MINTNTNTKFLYFITLILFVLFLGLALTREHFVKSKILEAQKSSTDRFTLSDMRRWAIELRKSNPNIIVPEPTHIIKE